MWKGIAMELFHEIYSCYFDVVRRILAEAQDTPVSVKRMEEIALSHGFQETALAILPKLTSGAWPLLEEAGEKEYRSRLSQAPRTPLSSLQKSWLKALLRDRRIRLFLTDEDIARLTRELSQVQPRRLSYQHASEFCKNKGMPAFLRTCPGFCHRIQIPAGEPGCGACAAANQRRT